jgi:hypothetical protein
MCSSDGWQGWTSRYIPYPPLGIIIKRRFVKKKLVPYGKAYLFSGEGQTDEVHEAARAIL